MRYIPSHTVEQIEDEEAPDAVPIVQVVVPIPWSDEVDLEELAEGVARLLMMAWESDE